MYLYPWWSLRAKILSDLILGTQKPSLEILYALRLPSSVYSRNHVVNLSSMFFSITPQIHYI